MKLLLGTNNRGKIVEISEVLSDLPLELLTPQTLNLSTDVEETADTFHENALLKARHFSKLSKLPTLADDSGIIVDALKDELGVQTRRWGAGPAASDEEWIDHFLKRMKRETSKRATFVCCMAFVDQDGIEYMFEGTCAGAITDTLESSYLPGLPISACFMPDGHSAVYSAMSIEQKNSTSHRGKALKQVRQFLQCRNEFRHVSAR